MGQTLLALYDDCDRFSFHQHLPVEDQVKDHRCLALASCLTVCISFILFSAKLQTSLHFVEHCDSLSHHKSRHSTWFKSKIVF